MELKEGTFETYYTDKNSKEFKDDLFNALFDLYSNLNKYYLIKKKNVNKDYTLKFQLDYNISDKDIFKFLSENILKIPMNTIFYYGDILEDRDRIDRKTNRGIKLYIFYFTNVKLKDYDSSTNNEPLIEVKWSVKNKTILSFHEMRHMHRSKPKTESNKIFGDVMKMIKEDVQCGGAIANVLPTSNKKPKKQPQKISYLKTAKICCEDENLWTFKYDNTEIKFNATCEKFGRALRKIRDFDKDDTYQNMAREIQDSDGEWFEIECDENKLPKNYSDMLKLF